MRRKIFLSNTTDDVESATVNLTPLIDVVFVVLIMFIIIAPLLNIDRVQLAAGSTNVKEQPDFGKKSSIVIHVYSDNSIRLNQVPVTIRELHLRLGEAYSRFPNDKPQLFHDKSAFFGTYQTVKNAVESAGFSQMDIVLGSGTK